MNDVNNLNIKKTKRFLPEDESERYSRDRPYSIEEIEQILEKCDVRSRVIILLLASSGMRIGALYDLWIEDIKKMDEFGVYLIRPYNRSKAHSYYTFCTPECAAAIDAYLDYRRKFGEEIKDKSPLIREQFDIDDYPRANSPRFLSTMMMTRAIADVLKRSGVNSIAVGNKRRDVMRTHGFRKFFITRCDMANVNFTVREFLSGHKLPNLDSTYNHRHRNEEDMLAEYVKAIPYLTIDPTQRLQQENQELKKASMDYLVELGDLRQEFNEMKQMFVNLNRSNRW
jgi:integrase